MAFPATYNFNYYAGDTFEFLIYPKDSQGGVFTDLENYTVRFAIAQSRGATPDLDSGVLFGEPPNTFSKLIAEISETNDYIICQIVAQWGAGLTNSSYVYDVQIQDGGSGKVYTLVTGTITVQQDITG